MTKIFFYLLLIVFLAHGAYNLERSLFITEIYSLIGLIIFITHGHYRLKKLKQEPASWLVLFIYYSALIAALSLLHSTAPAYEFIRTTTIIYSPLIFFIGYHVALKTQKLGKYFLILSIPTSIFGTERISLASSILGINHKKKTVPAVIIISSLLLHSFYMGVSTPVLAAALILALIATHHALNNTKVLGKKTVLALSSLGLFFPVFIYIYLKPYFEPFVSQGYTAFGNEVDNNAYWRLMYWYHLVSQTLTSNPITGIGFGTKLFSSNDQNLWWLVVTQHSINNQSIEYVLGPHNSLIYIFSRTGAIGLFMFLGFLFSFFYKIFSQKNLNIVILSSFCILNTNMFFNVILESPIWSINYWFTTGYIYYTLKNTEKPT